MQLGTDISILVLHGRFKYAHLLFAVRWIDASSQDDSTERRDRPGKLRTFIYPERFIVLVIGIVKELGCSHAATFLKYYFNFILIFFSLQTLHPRALRRCIDRCAASKIPKKRRRRVQIYICPTLMNRNMENFDEDK